MRQPTQSEWPEIWRLFDQLVDLPADERDAALARAKAGPFITEQVLSLLRAGTGDGPLDVAAATGGAESPGDYASLAAGTVVGAFRVVRLIGRGGMGEVYLAERSTGFAQRVALKMLRPEAVARAQQFESERALLASLEHPGIARLIDGGMADDGRAYMAMEYVEGEDIGRWCARHRASADERLRLFLDLCEAVSYAHARLVVHRDIKLANILIDGEGRVRLLDFGIAQLVDETIDRTMTLAMLTPDYAAPEQLRNLRPTVATDVYALGAVLYELLTGTGPWRGGAGAVSSLLRRALHDDPIAPSRLAREKGESPVPPQRIAGDLDAIVLKAMRNDPADRYASVADLAEDVRRHRDLRPVRAHDGSRSYRLRRFVQRNKWGVVSGAALALALIAGTAGIAWQARQAGVERDIARSELRRSEAAFNAMTLLFRDASDAGQIGSATAREMLNSSARNLIATGSPGDPATAEAVLTLADLYILTEDITGADAFLRRAMEAGVGKHDAATMARMQQRLGMVSAAQGKLPEAEKLLAAADRVFRTDPARFRVERQDAISARAYMLRMSGRRDEAIKLFENSLPEARLAYAGNPRELLTRYANLGLHYIESARLDDAARILGQGEALARRANMTSSSQGLMIQNHAATLRAMRGDLDGARGAYEHVAKLRRELYGRSAGLGFALLQLGGMQLATGREAEALATLDEAKPLIGNFLGPASQPGMVVRMNRVEALAALGRVSDAEAELAGVETDFAKQGVKLPENAPFLRARAALYIAQGRYESARADLAAARRMLAVKGAAAGPSLAIIDRLAGRLR